MKLLILGTAILAVSNAAFIDDGENIRTYTPEGKADVIFPKAVIAGYQLVTTGVPNDFSLATHEYVGGNVVPKPPTAAQLQRDKDAFNSDILDKIDKQEAKQARAVRDVLAALAQGQIPVPADTTVLLDIKTKIDTLRAKLKP